MIINRWIDFGLVIAFILFASFYLFFQADTYVLEHFAPDPVALCLYVVSATLVMALRDPVLRFFGLVWTVWPVLGTYFSVGHFFKRYLWAPLDLAEPNLVFYLGTITMLVGLHIYLLSRPLGPARVELRIWTPYEVFPLLIFPLAYAATLITTGSTLLTGRSIVEEIYSVNRGPIYGLRIAIVMTIIWLGLYYRRVNRSRKLIVGIAIAVTLSMSVLDGKRDLALLGILGLLSIMMARMNKSFHAWRLFAFVISILFLYGLVGNLRASQSVDYTSWIDLATIAGVEYRDFAHSINYWTPGSLSTFGYDFLRSAVGSLLNEEILVFRV